MKHFILLIIKRFRACDDFQKFARNGGLSRFVIGQFQLFQQHRGVVACLLHCRHSRALFRRHGVQKRPIKRNFQHTRIEPLQNGFFVRFHDEIHRQTLRLFAHRRRQYRQKL